MTRIAELTTNSRNDNGFVAPATWQAALVAVYEGGNVDGPGRLRDDEARAVLLEAITLATAKVEARLPAELIGHVANWDQLRSLLLEDFARNASTASETPGTRALFEMIGAAADLP